MSPNHAGSIWPAGRRCQQPRKSRLKSRGGAKTFSRAITGRIVYFPALSAFSFVLVCIRLRSGSLAWTSSRLSFLGTSGEAGWSTRCRYVRPFGPVRGPTTASADLCGPFRPPYEGRSPPASYAVRVPRIVALPAASFRPHLAVAALAVRLAVSAMWTCRGLKPLSRCPCRARMKTPQAKAWGLVAFSIKK